MRLVIPVLVLSLTIPHASIACVGDCDWSGQVSVNELVSMVNVALDRSPLASCAAGDNDRQGDITVNELVTAVNVLLSGCPSAPADGVAAATLSLTRSVLGTTRLTPAVGLALDGAGGPTPCELGGAIAAECEDVAPGLGRVTITSNDCRDYTYESTLGYYGTATVNGSGNCDAGVSLDNFGFAWNVVNETEARVPLLDTRIDATLRVKQFLLGEAPCAIRGGIVEVDGDLTHQTPDGRQVAVHYDRAQARTDFSDFIMQFGCEPLTVKATADGRLDLRDTYGSGELAFAAEAEGIAVNIDRDGDLLTVEGTAKGHCFNGTARITTLEPLRLTLGNSCFTAGALQIVTVVGTSHVMIDEDSSIDIDTNADGAPDVHYESCTDLPARCTP